MMSENDKPDAAESTPKRILVRTSNWLGDAVMTAPAVRAVKRSFPEARLAVLTRSKLADFWKAVAEVDEVVSIEPGDSVFAVAKKIAGRFDSALLLPNSVRSALEVFLARIPRRVGRRGKLRSRLLTEILDGETKPSPPRHQMHHYLDLAEFFGAKIDGDDRHVERVFGKIQTRKRPWGEGGNPKSQAERSETSCPSDSKTNQLIQNVKIALCPGAEYGPAKRWLPERFAEVVRTVSARRDCEWVFFGAAKDAPVGEEIAQRLEGNFTNLIGRTTLAELMAGLAECHLLLTNDTGTMHLAAFLGVPTVSIFGSTEPALTGPLGPGHRVLRHHVECSPCFLRECPLDFRCMESVTADEVVEAVLRMIQE